MTRHDESPNSLEFFGYAVVLAIFIAGLKLTYNIQQSQLNSLAETQTQTDARKIFEASKEAPSLEDIAARYETADTALYDALVDSVYAAYTRRPFDCKPVSFGNFISQYYYANATDSVNPWLLWYESRTEFASR